MVLGQWEHGGGAEGTGAGHLPGLVLMGKAELAAQDLECLGWAVVISVNCVSWCSPARSSVEAVLQPRNAGEIHWKSFPHWEASSACW